jgi:hypothetical protein
MRAKFRYVLLALQHTVQHFKVDITSKLEKREYENSIKLCSSTYVVYGGSV